MIIYQNVIIISALVKLCICADTCIPSRFCFLVLNRIFPCCSAKEEKVESTTSYFDKSDNEKCGMQIVSEKRIIGNDEASLGEFPWIGMIYYERSSLSQCAGTLISHKLVVTAAHCLIGTVEKVAGKPSYVRLGEHDLRTEIDCKKNNQKIYCAPRPINVPVSNFLSHAAYKAEENSQNNDIGLIKLKYSVEYTDFIRPICLPTTYFLEEKMRLYVAGWGRTKTASTSAVKMKAPVPLLNTGVCTQVYKSSNFTEGQLCAGGEEGFDSCRGDSGGPLMLQESKSNIWLIMGIVSFGPKICGRQGFPAIYTNVSYFSQWIDNNSLLLELL